MVPRVSFQNVIIPAPQRYANFEQFDWLEKKKYTPINYISRKPLTIFLSPAPKMYNIVDRNMILMKKLEL